MESDAVIFAVKRDIQEVAYLRKALVREVVVVSIIQASKF
jgi:hypothetical protein